MPAKERPNILWLVSEDNNPFLGCYGDRLARTPNLDRLAAEGVLFRNCHSGAPVCAPARYTLITGTEPANNPGAMGMRSRSYPRIPGHVRPFPQFLREAGYYCANNGKTDYNSNVDTERTWDACANAEVGQEIHWRNRPEGKPFFCVFNCGISHEGQIHPGRYTPPAEPTDPADVELPLYHPDTPTFRSDRAHYYDQIHRMDAWMGEMLNQLEADGLAEDTIVFYYGDNGGILPRSKRYLFNTGTHVPLIVRFPEKYSHLAPAAPGQEVTDPVGFVDFAPTVLSLAGVEPPDYLQGQAFAGRRHEVPREYTYCYRGRMDERIDFSRAVKSDRYVYIRNYMPHLIYGQYVGYMFRMRSMTEWKELYETDKLEGPQKSFWEPKPAEELYDTQVDPDEINNLAGDVAHRELLEEMRRANSEHILAIRDVGFIPESVAEQYRDKLDDDATYNLLRLIEVTDLVTRRDPAELETLQKWLTDDDEIVRYWAAMGCLMLAEHADDVTDDLEAAMSDDFLPVRTPAAEALCRMGRSDKALDVLGTLVAQGNPEQLAAANAVDRLGETARPLVGRMQSALQEPDVDRYVARALQHTLVELGLEPAKS